MEWLQNNIVAIAGLAIGWLASVAVLVWRLSSIATTSRANGDKMESLAEALAQQQTDFVKHIQDDRVHTTFEQRQEFNRRLDRIESSVSQGHANIEAKLDKLTDRLLVTKTLG